MDAVDQRVRRDIRRDADAYTPATAATTVKEEPAPHRGIPGAPAAASLEVATTGYTLMVAGRRTGKTSFLRLLLDTSLVAPSASADQLLSVAKFVQGCGAHTSHVRTVSLDIDLASEAEDPQHLNLTLIDTPSLDFKDDAASQRTVSEILRHVDARFAESVEDVGRPLPSVKSLLSMCLAPQERKALTGNHHVHL